MFVSNLGYVMLFLACAVFLGFFVMYVLAAASHHARRDAWEALTWEAGFVLLLGGLIAQALLWSLGDQVAEVMQVIFTLLSMVVAYFVITVITRGIARLFPRLARWNP